MNHQHEDYVTLETAKLAKQCGFHWGTETYYHEHNPTLEKLFVTVEKTIDGESRVHPSYAWQYPRPTQTILQKWFRDVKGINIGVTVQENEDEETLWVANAGYLPITECVSSSYEGALEFMLRQTAIYYLEEKIK